MKNNRLLISLGVLALVESLIPLQAAQVWFSSSIEGGHYTSTGAQLGEDTIVELGAFAPGFTPTAQNTGEWKQNWTPAARSLYDSQNRWYNGTFTVPNNSSTFSSGQQGWIWIFNRNGEWCLFSKSTWTWPSTAGETFSQPVVQWSAQEASITVVGQVANPTQEITTARVSDASSPGVTFDQWASLLFPGDTAVLPAGDNDGDGISNFAEYALGSRADRAGSMPGNHSIAHQEGSLRYLAVAIDKGWTTGVNFSATLSQDLRTWDGSGASIMVLEDSSTTFKARDSQPLGTRQRAFIRLNAGR